MGLLKSYINTSLLVLLFTSVMSYEVAGATECKASVIANGKNMALREAMQVLAEDLREAEAAIANATRSTVVTADESLRLAIVRLKNSEDLHEVLFDGAKTVYLPPSLASIPDDKKEAFLVAYQTSYRHSQSLYRDMREAVEVLLSQPYEDRDYTNLSEASSRMSDFINRIHRRF